MATTSPDSVYYPVGTDQVGPLDTVLAAMSSSVQMALSARQAKSYIWADAAARTAQTGMTTHATGLQVDTQTYYIYLNNTWVLATPHAEFTTGSTVVGSSTLSNIGVFSLDSGNSTRSSGFVNIAGNGRLTVVNPGIYDVSFFTSWSGASSTFGGRNFIEIGTGDETAAPYARDNFTEGFASVSIPNLRIGTANSILGFRGFQASATPSKTVSSVVRITRIG